MNRWIGVFGWFAFAVVAGWLVGGCQQVRHQAAARVDVSLRQMQFAPAEVRVHAGDTVVFTNNDIVTHDVTEETAKLWTSGPLVVGESFAFVAQKDVTYYCSIHPIMKGKITVE